MKKRLYINRWIEGIDEKCGANHLEILRRDLKRLGIDAPVYDLNARKLHGYRQNPLVVMFNTEEDFNLYRLYGCVEKSDRILVHINYGPNDVDETYNFKMGDWLEAGYEDAK